MKRVFVITVMFALAALCAFGQVTISTAVEPALNAPARFGVSVAGALNVTESNSVSLRYGSGNTVLAGVGRKFVEFMPGLTLVGDLQAGGSHNAAHTRGLVLYGGL